MVIPAPDPLSAVSSSINATIKILEVTYQLKAVDEQTADLLSTTRHVDFMVQEARRLRRLKAGLLNTSERIMIDTVINDTEDALRAVAKLVEPCRVDKSTKKGIRFGHRVMWVFRDNPSVRDKHQKLQVCYQSLTVVFACLYSKDPVVIAPAPEGKIEEQPPPYDPELKELLDWQNRRKGRKSLGDKEAPTSEDLGLKKGGSDDIPFAGPLRSCLMAVPLKEDNDEVLSLSNSLSEMSFKLPTMHAPEAQPSVPHNNETLPSPATTSPESNSGFLPTSAHVSDSYDEIRSTPLSNYKNARNDYVDPTQSLPEIDSPPLATMIAPYAFDKNVEDCLKVEDGELPHAAWNQKPSSSAHNLDTTPSDTSSFPTLPSSAVTMPTSSRLSTGYDLGLRWLQSSREDSYGYQKPTEASTLGQHPLPARLKSDPLPVKSNSDIQLTTYQSDRLDSLARAQEAMTREDSAVGIGERGVKRGGHSWLAYHATRGDMGHGMDWDG